MHLENVVVDAVDPRALGRFWEDRLGTERLTDEPGIFETRLAVPGGPVLDLCFQQVPASPTGRPRLDLVLAGPPPDAAHTDPEGHPFRVVATDDDAATGPLVAVTLQSADPRRDLAFWSWLTGWTPVADAAAATLRHPSGRGPVLELHPEQEPKTGGKNPRHLDVRLAAGEDADAVTAGITERGGRELHPDWGDLPWRLYVDPSGNDLCVLPGPA